MTWCEDKESRGDCAQEDAMYNYVQTKGKISCWCVCGGETNQRWLWFESARSMSSIIPAALMFWSSQGVGEERIKTSMRKWRYWYSLQTQTTATVEDCKITTLSRLFMLTDNIISCFAYFQISRFIFQCNTKRPRHLMQWEIRWSLKRPRGRAQEMQ